MPSPEQIVAKKQFAGQKKTSMHRRSDSHDYSERRMYMITMEVEGRRPLFGRIIGNPYAPANSSDAPRIELTELGRAVHDEWMGIHAYYPQIEVRAVQMMPDHMHGILFVKSRLPVHLGQVISGFKAGCRKRQRALEGAAAKPQPTEKKGTQSAGEQGARSAGEQGTQSAGMEGEAANRAAASPQVAALPPQGTAQLFAKGYNDLILRSYEELQNWEHYLRDNPRRLLLKRARPDWLRPFFNLKIGATTYSGIGNRNLLRSPRRLPVRVSRRLTKEQIEAVTTQYMEAARHGAVLVSPAISPGEKQVMRTAFDAGFPTIVLMENGFTAMSKPKGEQFDACANGRLLMLSPWEHHNEKRAINAAQCTQLNLMAIEISSSD
ncbi:MAG: hypothetical protein IKI19_01240 [Prevotella sp.]|nr:hypothetical protein [Prevotella sp.]